MFINHEPVMTLTYFTARSTWVTYAFDLGKLLKCHLKGNFFLKLANGQNQKDMIPWFHLLLHWGYTP